jgi:hypothetical protein
LAFWLLNGHVSSLTRHWSYVHPVNPEKESEKKTEKKVGMAYWHGILVSSIGGGQQL